MRRKTLNDKQNKMRKNKTKVKKVEKRTTLI